MSIQAPVYFNTQFQTEVKHQYQLMGPQLRGISQETSVVGADRAVFKKMGTTVATTKPRHGLIPTQNIDHSTVTVLMQDYWAADYVDSMDLLKTNIDYRKQYAKSMAKAMGRRWDLTYVTAIDLTTSTVIAAASAGLNYTKTLDAIQAFDEADIPADGRTLIIGMQQLRELRNNVDEFKNFDYNSGKPTATGVQKFSWLGVDVVAFNGLPLTGAGGSRACFLVHADAVGVGMNKDITLKAPFIDERESTLVHACMSLGATIIEDAGVVQIDCVE